MDLVIVLFIQFIKQFLRNPHWKSKTVLRIFGVFILLQGVFSGIQLDFLLSEIAPDQPPYLLVNQYLFYAFLGVFLYRLLFATLNLLPVKPLLLLNISKKQVLHFILLKSFFNYISIFLVMLLVPFAFISITREFSIFSALCWVLFILIADQIFNQLVLFIRIHFNRLIFKVVLALSLILAIINTYFLHIVFSEASFLWFFNLPLYHYKSVWLVALILCVIYRVNHEFLSKLVTLDHACFHAIIQQKKSIFDRIQTWGEDWKYIALHLKQTFRDKRSRAGFFYLMSFFVLINIVFFVYIFKPVIGSIKDSIFLMFFSLYYVLAYMQIYSLFFMSWDTHRIDFVFSNYIDYRKYVDSRIRTVHLLAFIVYLTITPFSIYISNLWWMSLMCYLFAIGVMHNFYIIISILQMKKIDVSKPVFNNAEGMNWHFTLLMIFLYILIVTLSVLFQENINISFYILGSTGLFGLLFYNQWLSLIMKFINKDKYDILETLRY